jgi:hypothetical protein
VYGTSTGSDFASRTYTGDGTSGIFIWGAQLEAGAFPSSYIPTVAASATRAADSLSYTAGVSYPFSAYAEYQRGGTAGTQNNALGFGVSTANQQIYIGNNVGSIQTSEAQFWVRDTGDSAFLRHASGTSPIDTTVKQAGRIGIDDFASCVSGGTVLTDTSGTVPTISQMHLGQDIGGGRPLFGHIRRIAIVQGAVSDANLQGMTQ